MRTPLFGVLGLVALVAGCGTRGDDDGGDAGPSPTARLMVVVTTPTLHWADGVGESTTLEAILIDDLGTRTDVTADASFEVVPAQLGTITGATLTAGGDMAGPGQVFANVPNYLGMGDVEVFVTETVGGNADPASAGLFGAATLDTAGTIQLAYPPAGATIPPNLGEMDVHWRDATKNVYEVQLSGGFVTLKTYVNTLGAATWTTLADAMWKRLSQGSRGVDLEVRVRGLHTNAPATFIEGKEMVHIAAEEVKGGVYWWNTADNNNARIFRYDMSTPAVAPEQFYPQNGQSGCVGCHAVSRDGSVVAFRENGDNMNYGNSMSVATQTKQLTQNSHQWNFAAVHPNNTDLFTTKTDGMWRIDLTTGAASQLYNATRIAQPDVSADGKKIIATTVLTGSEVWTNSGNLVVFDYDATAKTIGAPTTLVPAAGGKFPYYGSFSPDNEWVIYNQATITSSASQSSYDNPNAEMWVTKADGTGTPIRLTAAEVAGASNSWPKWTPFITMEPTATGSEKVIWFTVASRRPFGVRTVGAQRPQLWLAPFYPERGATGPMVRLPFQDLALGNHIAQWTEQIVTIQ